MLSMTVLIVSCSIKIYQLLIYTDAMIEKTILEMADS